MELLGTLLAIVLIILGLLALGVLILLALLIFAPFRVAGRVSRWPVQRATGRVLVNWPASWLLGLEVAFDSVGQAFTLWLGPWAVWRRYEERGPEEKEEEEFWERLAEKIEEVVDEEKEEEGGPSWPLTWRETLAQWGVLAEVMRAVVRILDSLHWERLRLRGRVGLGDPALTGMLYGAYEASRRGWSRLVDVRLVPEFVEPALWGEAEGAVRIWVWRVLWPLVRLVFSRPSRRLIWALIRGWWRNRRRPQRETRWQRARRRWQHEPATVG